MGEARSRPIETRFWRSTSKTTKLAAGVVDRSGLVRSFLVVPTRADVAGTGARAALRAGR
jgi:hypothetical protein